MAEPMGNERLIDRCQNYSAHSHQNAAIMVLEQAHAIRTGLFA
jgi:hypothetical protein